MIFKTRIRIKHNTGPAAVAAVVQILPGSFLFYA